MAYQIVALVACAFWFGSAVLIWCTVSSGFHVEKDSSALWAFITCVFLAFAFAIVALF